MDPNAKKSNVLFPVLLAIVITAIIASGATFFAVKKTMTAPVQQSATSQTAPTTVPPVTNLSMPVTVSSIQSLYANPLVSHWNMSISGTISKIDGNTVTITQNNNSLTFSYNSSTTFVDTTGKTTVDLTSLPKIKPTDIHVGDTVGVIVLLYPNAAPTVVSITHTQKP